LLGRSAADGLDEKRVNAAFGVVARDARQPAINHVADAINGDRGFRDVGGDDHLAEGTGRESKVLLLGRQVAVQGDQCQALGAAKGAEGGEGGVDFGHAGHEDQDVAGVARVDDLLDGIGGLLWDWPFVPPVQIAHRDGETLPFRQQNRRSSRLPSQVLRHRFRLKRGGHDRQLKLGPVGLLQAFYQGQRDIAQQVALMEFVEEDRPHI